MSWLLQFDFLHQLLRNLPGEDFLPGQGSDDFVATLEEGFDLLQRLLGRSELEFLAADTGFEHQSAFGDGEHRHPVLILGVGGGTLGGGHGADLGAKGEFTFF